MEAALVCRRWNCGWSTRLKWWQMEDRLMSTAGEEMEVAQARQGSRKWRDGLALAGNTRSQLQGC